VEFAIHDCLVEGGFVSFDFVSFGISPLFACAKLDLLLSRHNPGFPQLAQPLAHIFNVFVVDM
jgi:hypothetical protein